MTDRWDGVIDRLERLMERAELMLGSGAAVPPPSLLDSACAFRWESSGRGGRIVPVGHPHLVALEDLVGIDMVKDAVVRNTAQFVAGAPANNVLLWGERGTGKSSLVKGLMKPFADMGLRLIGVQRHDLGHLPAICALVRDLPFRFILFCDDLAFAAGDPSYHELKTLLDGGLDARPENLLIYATSNRRHLMPEPMADNVGGEIHPEEAVADKLSLADRFGLSFSFYSFNQEEYLAIVEHWADRYGLACDREELRKEALRWAMYRGQRSGRAAEQFVVDLAGREQLAERQG